nr:MAG TPA: hypothetical protein [Caudoviricetes sp.]
MKKYRINVTEIDEQGNETPWEPGEIEECNGFFFLGVDRSREQEEDKTAMQSVIHGINIRHLAIGVENDKHLYQGALLAVMNKRLGGKAQKPDVEEEA